MTTGKERQMQMSIETITPEMAGGYLLKNDCNRPVNRSWVDFLAGEMAAGRWELNGESIVFAEDGTLLQGQHRMHGVIQSGQPITTLVVRGVKKDTFKTMDQVKRRSARDVLSISHIDNSTAVGGAARIVLIEERDLLQLSWSVRFSNADVLDCVMRHPGLEWATSETLTAAKLLGIGGGALGWFNYRLRSCKDTATATRFLDKLASGEMLTATDPIYLLRRRLIEEKSSRYQLRTRDQAALLVRSWNAVYQGRTMKQLKALRRAVGNDTAVDSFPHILGVLPISACRSKV